MHNFLAKTKYCIIKYQTFLSFSKDLQRFEVIEFHQKLSIIFLDFKKTGFYFQMSMGNGVFVYFGSKNHSESECMN